MRSFADEHEPVAHEETADNTVLPCILLRIGLKIRLIHMDANLIFRVKLKVNKKQSVFLAALLRNFDDLAEMCALEYSIRSIHMDANLNQGNGKEISEKWGKEGYRSVFLAALLRNFDDLAEMCALEVAFTISS
ncbi:uncharacterized protein HKW66_Vig0237700 [Vigna angularis]|uniref:Uncharacterized protein n=1 Tax=Phaseolus angularis TaxID=3914 RepID=A0A8T0KWE3_PHAAN|nr:uncharacterized protein HKW66_Vig0237700 [Vigna angularis]